MGYWADQVTRLQELYAALSAGANASVRFGGVDYTQKDLEKVHNLLLAAEREAIARGEMAAPGGASVVRIVPTMGRP